MNVQYLSCYVKPKCYIDICMASTFVCIWNSNMNYSNKLNFHLTSASIKRKTSKNLQNTKVSYIPSKILIYLCLKLVRTKHNQHFPILDTQYLIHTQPGVHIVHSIATNSIWIDDDDDMVRPFDMRWKKLYNI